MVGLYKSLSRFLILASLLASCTLRRNGGAPQPSATAGISTTPATPSTATGENPTSTAMQTDEESSDYIRTLEAMGIGKYLDVSDTGRTRESSNGWDIYRYDLSECKCILGGDYFVQTRAGSEQDKTILWMDGGGMCYPGREDCVKEATTHETILQTGLVSKNIRNPVRNWNAVYVPYCDGSAHLGDADADYDLDGIPDHWHWGLKDVSAAVRLMKELYPDSRKILIAGCSAGGYGTIGVSALVRLAFPNADLYVMNQSGGGIVNPAMAEDHELFLQTWNMDAFFPADCPDCRSQFLNFYSWQLARDSRLKVGYFSSYGDATATKNWNLTADQFRSLLLGITDAIHAQFPKTFNRFFINGDDHCVQDYTYAVDGVTILTWIRQLVNDDPDWGDILE
jgi:hypothetical protein